VTAVPKRVLIAERNVKVLKQISHALSASGYAVCEAQTGREALRCVQLERPDLVLVGLVLSDIGGKDLARILTSNGDSTPVPTIVLAEPGTQYDEVLVSGGAPEKPVVRWTGVDEVVTLVNDCFAPPEEDAEECYVRTLRFDGILIDPTRSCVEVHGEPLELTNKEFRFLHVLAVNGDRTCTREELRRRVWGDEMEVIGRTVDVLVSRLRSKLTSASGQELISTIRGVGYRFTGDPLQ
jgi:DNA-binding response OmpR family regulator